MKSCIEILKLQWNGLDIETFVSSAIVALLSGILFLIFLKKIIIATHHITKVEFT